MNCRNCSSITGVKTITTYIHWCAVCGALHIWDRGSYRLLVPQSNEDRLAAIERRACARERTPSAVPEPNPGAAGF